MQKGAPDPERPLPDDLHRWVEADLITWEQARGIARFESERTQVESRGRASQAVALLGALTLVSGVGSLVAYNWDRLSDGLKLVGLGVLLVLALAASVLAERRRGETLATDAGPEANSTFLDVSILIASGLTLAGLSLVSQIYHQDGKLWQLLFAWSLVTAPLMSFTRTKFAHVFWYVGLFISLVSSADEASDFVRDALSSDSEHAGWTTLLTFGTLAVVLAERFAASRFSGRAFVGRAFVGLWLVGLGLFGGLFWFHGDDGKVLFWALGAIASGAIFAAAPQSLAQIGFGSAMQVKVLFAVGLALSVLPMGFSVESGFLAFVAFLTFWGLAWYFAEQSGSVRGARWAVLFLGGRVVIASFELFESLLVTGGVLIGLGVLALAWSKHALGRESREVARG